MYIIKNGAKEHIIEAYDQENNLVGDAVFSPFKPSDIFERPRLNIYIDIRVTDVANKDELRDQMFDELIRRARAVKDENKDIDVRVYHCCFPDNKENIAYFSGKEGFKHDEGMHIIRKEITEENFDIVDIDGIDIVNLDFENEDELKQLVEKQNKVFVSGYSVEDLKEIKSQNQWLSIAAKHQDEIVGNILIVIKEDESNTKYGWVDDLFVSSEWRKKGIAKNLILKALEELKAINVNDSRLEVWSANTRAMSVYNSVGYKFYNEIESSIGRFL